MEKEGSNILKREQKIEIKKSITEKIKSKKVIIPIVLIVGIFILGVYFLRTDVLEPDIPIKNKEDKSSVEMVKSGATAELEEIAVNVLPDSLPIGAKIKIDKVAKKPSLANNKNYASDVYNIRANQKVSGPIIIELDIDRGKLPSGAKIENLYAAYWDEEKWVPADGFIDFQRNKLVVQTDHFSWWTALYDRVSAVWDDKIEPVYWHDVPSDLQEKISGDLGLKRDDIIAIEHAQFSSFTKAATFAIGLANQVANVSSILGGIESENELAKAVIEKVAEDTAKSGGGEFGELTVEVYEAGKTGYAVGKVIGHTVLKTGFAAAELQNAAPQVLGYILEKEMAYINKNTSSLFEYISLYDSGTLDRIDTYIFFYDASAPERLRSRGVALYYWAPTYKKWQKGKNVNTVSDIMVKVIEKAEESSKEEESTEDKQYLPEKNISISKNVFPEELLGRSLFIADDIASKDTCFHSSSPNKYVSAGYGSQNDLILVSLTQYDNVKTAMNVPEECLEFIESKMSQSGSVNSVNLKKKNDVSGYSFWLAKGNVEGLNVIISSFSVIGNTVITVMIPDTGGEEKGHISIVSSVIEALEKVESESISEESSSKPSAETSAQISETSKTGCQNIDISDDYSFYDYTLSGSICSSFEKTFSSSKASFKCKSAYGSWRGYWVKEIDVSNNSKINIKADLELNEHKNFFSECRGKEAGVKYDDYSALIVLSSDPREKFAKECNKTSSEKLECNIHFSGSSVDDKDPSVISYCGVPQCKSSVKCDFEVNVSGRNKVYLVFRTSDAWNFADVEGVMSNLQVCGVN